MDKGSRLRIVLDTNVLLVSVSPYSRFHWIIQDLLADKYELLVSNEILAEYAEIIGKKIDPDVARDTLRALLALPNVRCVNPSYHWNLIFADPDDNKFVDCAVAAAAYAIVTEDRHFDVLREVPFPVIRVLNIDGLVELLAARADSDHR